MIFRARTVITMDGPPIADGAVAVNGNRIVDVGVFDEVKARVADEVIDLGEQAILPGLINAHCHLDYTMMRHAIAPPRQFADWIRKINALKRTLSDDDYLAGIARGFAEAQKWGTTSIANIEAFPELLVRMPRPPLRTWWFYELIDVRSRVATEELMAGALSFFDNKEHWLGGFGLSPHAPYTASSELYKLAAECARGNGMMLTTHVAESREEMRMFRDGDGPLFNLLHELGRTADSAGETPLAYLLTRHRVDENWIVAHLNELSDDDFTRLVDAEKFHIVYCPRSHKYFGHTPFALDRLRALGFNICLGTDSLASNSSLNLFAEMQAAREANPNLTAEDALAMTTLHAARALHQDDQLGRVRAGFLADLIAVPMPVAEMSHIFENIVETRQPATWVMVDGRVLTGPGRG